MLGWYLETGRCLPFKSLALPAPRATLELINHDNMAAKLDVGADVAAPKLISPAVISANAMVETAKTEQGSILQIVTAILLLLEVW